MHHRPKNTRPTSYARAFSLKKTIASACNCSGAIALNELVPFRTTNGAREKKAARVHHTHPMSMTSVASKGMPTLTGKNS